MAKIPVKNVNALVKFMQARERHRMVREGIWYFNGKTKADPIISRYRFCNVRRNDDSVTKWIHEKYLRRWRDSKHLWFALVVARIFNNEDTLASIAECALPFKPEPMRAHLQKRAAAGFKNFNAAYIVSTNGLAMDKVDYVVDKLLVPMWNNRDAIADMMQGGSLALAHEVLCQQRGLGSFMAAQVLADLKYARPAMWSDFNTFAASGPGSKRGLNRVMGMDKDTPWNEELFRAVLLDLRDMVNARLALPPITAQDMQNCLCEYDKYERVRNGEGRPKQLYTAPSKDALPWKED